MTAKPAHPDRYQVDRIGSPDPASSEYYVVDLVNDVDGRSVIAQLGNYYQRRGLTSQAKQCFDALHATQDAHKKVMDVRNAVNKEKAKKGRVVA